MTLIKFLGQVLPMTPDGILKFCVDVSFMNTSLHEKSGQLISAPPDQPDQAQHTTSQKLKDECSRVVKGIFGKELGGATFDSFRICWYESPNPVCSLRLTLFFRSGMDSRQIKTS